MTVKKIGSSAYYNVKSTTGSYYTTGSSSSRIKRIVVPEYIAPRTISGMQYYRTDFPSISEPLTTKPSHVYVGGGGGGSSRPAPAKPRGPDYNKLSKELGIPKDELKKLDQERLKIIERKLAKAKNQEAKQILKAYAEGKIKSFGERNGTIYVTGTKNLETAKQLGLPYMTPGGTIQKTQKGMTMVLRGKQWTPEITYKIPRKTLEQARKTDPHAYVIRDKEGVEKITTSNYELAVKLKEQGIPARYVKIEKNRILMQEMTPFIRRGEEEKAIAEQLKAKGYLYDQRTIEYIKKQFEQGKTEVEYEVIPTPNGKLLAAAPGTFKGWRKPPSKQKTKKQATEEMAETPSPLELTMGAEWVAKQEERLPETTKKARAFTVELERKYKKGLEKYWEEGKTEELLSRDIGKKPAERLKHAAAAFGSYFIASIGSIATAPEFITQTVGKNTPKALSAAKKGLEEKTKKIKKAAEKGDLIGMQVGLFEPTEQEVKLSKKAEETAKGIVKGTIEHPEMALATLAGFKVLSKATTQLTGRKVAEKLGLEEKARKQTQAFVGTETKVKISVKDQDKLAKLLKPEGGTQLTGQAGMIEVRTQVPGVLKKTTGREVQVLGRIDTAAASKTLATGSKGESVFTAYGGKAVSKITGKIRWLKGEKVTKIKPLTMKEYQDFFGISIKTKPSQGFIMQVSKGVRGKTATLGKWVTEKIKGRKVTTLETTGLTEQGTLIKGQHVEIGGKFKEISLLKQTKRYDVLSEKGATRVLDVTYEFTQKGKKITEPVLLKPTKGIGEVTKPTIVTSTPTTTSGGTMLKQAAETRQAAKTMQSFMEGVKAMQEQAVKQAAVTGLEASTSKVVTVTSPILLPKARQTKASATAVQAMKTTPQEAPSPLITPQSSMFNDLTPKDMTEGMIKPISINLLPPTTQAKTRVIPLAIPKKKKKTGEKEETTPGITPIQDIIGRQEERTLERTTLLQPPLITTEEETETPVPTFFEPPTPPRLGAGFGLPGMFPGGAPAKKPSKGFFSMVKKQYKPSAAAVLLGIKAERKPSIITGVEIRPIITTPKKKTTSAKRVKKEGGVKKMRKKRRTTRRKRKTTRKRKKRR